MILKDRLFSKYGDNLSLSNVNDELNWFYLSFTPTVFDPKTLLPFTCLVFMPVNKDGTKKAYKLPGMVSGSFKSELSSNDLYLMLEEVDKIILESCKIYHDLKEIVKKELVLQRYEQNKK